MTDQKIESPTVSNPLVEITNLVIDLAIQGIPPRLVIAHVTAHFPFLALPFVGFWFRRYVGVVSKAVSRGLKIHVDGILVRVQNGQINDEYKAAIEDLKKKTLEGKDEHDKAFAEVRQKMDRLINRAR